MTTTISSAPGRAGVDAAGKQRANRAQRKDTIFALSFLAPQLLGLIVFLLGPLVFAFALAFMKWDGFGTQEFVGLGNLQWVFTDPQMLTSLANTLWFTVLQVPGLLVSGFMAALLLQVTRKARNFYRVFYFAPVITSSVAVSAIWLWLLNPELSPINPVFKAVGITPPDWLQNPTTIIPVLVFVSIWQGMGYQMVMFMAGLENVPGSLMEAADIDGASQLQKLFRITIPLLSPTILFLSITTIIGSFQVFDYIYVFYDTTAPASARTIVYEIVQITFKELDFGRGAAIALVLFLILLAVTGLQMVAQKRWVHYTE